MFSTNIPVPVLYGYKNQTEKCKKQTDVVILLIFKNLIHHVMIGLNL